MGQPVPSRAKMIRSHRWMSVGSHVAVTMGECLFDLGGTRAMVRGGRWCQKTAGRPCSKLQKQEHSEGENLLPVVRPHLPLIPYPTVVHKPGWPALQAPKITKNYGSRRIVLHGSQAAGCVARTGGKTVE